jgi:hypothetical protein
MTTVEVEFEFREKEEVTWTQNRQVWGLQNHWNTVFGQNLFHRDGSVDRERSRHAASNCPHAQFLGQNVVDNLVIQIQFTTIHFDCQTLIRLHESPHVGHIFFHSCCIFIKFDAKFDHATMLKISFLHFCNVSLLHTLTQLAVKSDMLTR